MLRKIQVLLIKFICIKKKIYSYIQYNDLGFINVSVHVSFQIQIMYYFLFSFLVVCISVQTTVGLNFSRLNLLSHKDSEHFVSLT